MQENEVMSEEVTEVNDTEKAAEVAADDSKNGEIAEVNPTPEAVNAANAAASTGKVSDDGQGAAFFNSSDVRAMSREQVRRNLAKILKSMESPEF